MPTFHGEEEGHDRCRCGEYDGDRHEGHAQDPRPTGPLGWGCGTLPGSAWVLLTYRAFPARSRLHLPYGVPQNVRFCLGVPGVQVAPLLFGGPYMGVVGGAFELDLTARVPAEKADARVELGIVGR